MPDIVTYISNTCRIIGVWRPSSSKSPDDTAVLTSCWLVSTPRKAGENEIKRPEKVPCNCVPGTELWNESFTKNLSSNASLLDHYMRYVYCTVSACPILHLLYGRLQNSLLGSKALWIRAQDINRSYGSWPQHPCGHLALTNIVKQYQTQLQRQQKLKHQQTYIWNPVNQ